MENLEEVKKLEQEKKASLKSEIEQTVNQLKSICTDAHFADTLIDKMLSLKGQLSTDAVEIYVPLSELTKEYDYGSFKFIKTTKGIIFKMYGYQSYIKPIQQTLFGQINYLLDCKDRYEELTESDKDIYNALFAGTIAILMFPSICFCKDETWMPVSLKIMEEQKKLFELMDKELLPEEPEKDEKFNKEVADAEQLKEMITDTTEQLKSLKDGESE